ncbi:unnamed protein product [Clavelina lepadiformis]|uniref:Uncharacterized protein n=1 Tax=Clavelina lepadiformis TaxID=159417 RepID=A0ABP0GKL0_CLALP
MKIKFVKVGGDICKKHKFYKPLFILQFRVYLVLTCQKDPISTRHSTNLKRTLPRLNHLTLQCRGTSCRASDTENSKEKMQRFQGLVTSADQVQCKINWLGYCCQQKPVFWCEVVVIV